MKISVITAVYNRNATVGDAVESILSQTHQELELVIQDGGSNDGTLDVLRNFDDSRIRLVSEPDNGIYHAINLGIARADGDIIGLMHSDDFFAHNQVLERVAAAFLDPKIDGVYGDLDYVSSTNPARVIRVWRAGKYTTARLSRGWMPPHPTLYLRREVFEQWGNYDTQFRIAADYDAILRWLKKGEVRLSYLPEVLVRMRLGGESNRSLKSIVLKSLEDYRALRKNNVGGLYTIALKNVSKINQFWQKSI